MTTTAAQDEFNELMRDKERETRHPEDRLNDSDLSDPESIGKADDYLEKVDTDDELDIPRTMRSKYYIPSHIRSEANTGPKGVIADAQAYEQALKKTRRFTFKRSPSPPEQASKHWNEKDASAEADSEEGFMRKWRAARLKELQTVGPRIRSRTNSPSRRIYGDFPLLGEEGYLDAIEKSPKDLMVVVFIYADVLPPRTAQAKNLAHLIKCMEEVAKRNDTTRFLMFHNSQPGLDPENLPTVIAYQQGKEVAVLSQPLNQLPIPSEVSAVSLETCFRRESIL